PGTAGRWSQVERGVRVGGGRPPSTFEGKGGDRPAAGRGNASSARGSPRGRGEPGIRRASPGAGDPCAGPVGGRPAGPRKRGAEKAGCSKALAGFTLSRTLDGHRSEGVRVCRLLPVGGGQGDRRPGGSGAPLCARRGRWGPRAPGGGTRHRQDAAGEVDRTAA